MALSAFILLILSKKVKHNLNKTAKAIKQQRPLLTHVYWDSGDFLTWNRFERTGCILLAELDKTGINNLQQIPVFDDGSTIKIEKSGWGDHCLQKVNHLLAKGVTSSRYQRETFRVPTLKPILSHLRWAKLRRIRPGHFRKAIQLFSQGMK